MVLERKLLTALSVCPWFQPKLGLLDTVAGAGPKVWLVLNGPQRTVQVFSNLEGKRKTNLTDAPSW